MAKTTKKDIESFYNKLIFEIDATYKELDLIKNAGVAIGILIAIFTYIGYTTDRDAILGYASFSFFVFVFLFTLFNFLNRILRKSTNQGNVNFSAPQKIQMSSPPATLLNLFINNPLVNQIIMPMLNSLVAIYIALFFIHTLSLPYTPTGLHLNTLFALSTSWLVNAVYAISIVACVICIPLSFKKDKKLTFWGYAISTLFIELTSFSFVIYTLFINYPFWASYQLWLAFVINILVYFALVQYIYAVNARTRLVTYKNELSIVKARLDPLILSTLAGSINHNIYFKYKTLELEYKKLEKPKLVIAEGIPLLLGVYVTFDMSKEVQPI